MCSSDILQTILSSKNLQKNGIYIGIVLLVLVASYQYFHMRQLKYLSITSFKACVDAGYKVLVTYPEQCVLYGRHFTNPLQQKKSPENLTAEGSSSSYYKDQAYIIEGTQVKFRDGKGTLPANPILKQSSTTLTIMNEPFLYDINSDGIKDAIFLLRTNDQNTKNSYYITSSLSLHNGFYGVNAIFLDFDVHSAAFMYKNGEITVGYTTSESLTELKKKYFVLENDILKRLSHE